MRCEPRSTQCTLLNSVRSHHRIAHHPRLRIALAARPALYLAVDSRTFGFLQRLPPQLAVVRAAPLARCPLRFGSSPGSPSPHLLARRFQCPFSVLRRNYTAPHKLDLGSIVHYPAPDSPIPETQSPRTCTKSSRNSLSWSTRVRQRVVIDLPQPTKAIEGRLVGATACNSRAELDASAVA